jgi:anion-transporting  ArsA/GET3 family ATPase
MRTLIFTGNGGSGSALMAAATAAAAAATGARTLVASVGPSHSLSALFGLKVGNAPQAIANKIDAWNLDASTEMTNFYQQLRGKTSTSLSVSPDEFPLLPGVDLLAGIARISQQPAGEYDLLLLDAGPHDSLLRALAVPDSVRWGVRLVFGLDRGPGRSSNSLSSAVIPSTLIPFEWVGQLQDARVQLEQLRDQISDLRRTTVRYVLRPDLPALEEARLAVPALHLYGLAVDAIIAAPLLPNGPWTGTGLGDVAAEQERVASEAAQYWEPRPLLRGVSSGTPTNLEALTALGEALYVQRPLAEHYGVSAPISVGSASDPFISISLPGLPNDALGLTLSSDEIIVRVGPYRRHILLPDSMRGMTNIRAARSGDRLVIRPRV